MTPHHLLAEDLIDQVIGGIDCSAYDDIVIVSPDHFLQVPRGQFFLTNTDGQQYFAGDDYFSPLGEKIVVDNLGVSNEHGLTVARDKVAAHCPQVHIIPIAIQQTGTASWLRQLGSRLRTYPRTFLVISSDFSHSGDLPTTQSRDEQSIVGLATGHWDQINNDCPACWHLLRGYAGEAPYFRLLANRNSYDYSGVDTNITSYVTGMFYTTH